VPILSLAALRGCGSVYKAASKPLALPLHSQTSATAKQDMEQATSTKHSGEPNPLDTTGLCLLSLDGGGVRELSTLYILKSIMDQLNHELKGEPPVKPCEIFNLISGTSTGGWVDMLLAE